jgi:hypothetical protein
MGVAEIIGVIDFCFSLIFRLHALAKILAGSEPIPTIEEIYTKNAKLQAEIDAEKSEG